MTNAVRVRGLVKRFGSTVVLDGIDLDVGAGQSVGLSGQNGAGRTTLLQILAALRRPTSGEVAIAGVDALRRPIEARALVAYVDAEPHGAHGLTVREYMDFVVSTRLRHYHHHGSSHPPHVEPPRASIDESIARAELPPTAIAERLSTGQRKQLALAAALVAAPAVLLLDDPLSSLDEAARGRVVTWVRELRAAGTAFVCAVNTPEDSAALCDSVLRMQRGRILSSGAAVTHDSRSGIHALPATRRA
jgi:ABC-type multidrug transport system ATPase subunit